MPHKYTTENIEWLSVNRPLYAEQELSRRFFKKFKANVSPSALAQACCKRGFKPPLINIGSYKKGSVPFNKGLKGVRNSIKSEFTKGHSPHNALTVGMEVFSKDFWYTKVAEPNKWRTKHSVIYENEIGEIPVGSAVIFLDSDRNNFALDNLALVTRHELLQMNRHKYRQMPEQLKPAVLSLSRLEVKIFERGKQ